MKAMILAAGYGKRLRPLTDHTPKALIPIGKTNLLEKLLLRLHENGFNEIIINISYLGEQIKSYLEEKNYFGLDIHLSEETTPLETGGGVKHAMEMLKGDDFFLLHNVDVISDIDLEKMIAFHKRNVCFATLAVSKRKSSRYLVFDDQGLLIGRKNLKSGLDQLISNPERKTDYAFSGISVLSTAIFRYFGEQEKFSIVDTLLEAAGEEKIAAFPHAPDNWFDLGKIEDIEDIRQKIMRKKR